ncbi:hypothetical protein ATZ33_06555 [Enterococcus silesiacus]|uniref:4-phosphopantetheinyl transferase n=1 Tax=Enterococcus silesiacus TaxID=332949 RepID=A0A0S3K9R1_9ENTE|nr:4'-phosphopantetheinyl transferase superfamily protein [Enterococcus silesiacus]ALS01040.1 hypothetical protein ATZ33_06555 [Enterococcus silesiacus]OJG91735.1 4-phosphopantetheinyl transferase [Enterococcus silesiacus]
MLQLYCINITKDFSDDKIQNLLRYVSNETKERFHKFHFMEDSLRTLYGEILVRYISRTQFNFDTQQIIFTKNKYGKPYIKDNPLFFNISHSGEWVVCAFSSSEIGIDIEKIEKLNTNIAENFFSEYEYETLLNTENKKQLDYFYDIWTLKESYLKWLGTGLSTPLNSFHFHLNEKNIELNNNKIKNNLYFKQYPIPEYKLSVCSENNHFPKIVKEISVKDIKF